MAYKDLPPGKNPPVDVNAIIEIAKGEGHVKYEYDRHLDLIVVDRIRVSSMSYPINYGCIPNTLSEDGDPLDILVLGNSIQTGTVVAARPVGILMMEDEKGHDIKIIAVPADRVSSDYLDIQDINDIPATDRKVIEHFFKHYKDLETAKGKMSTTDGWQGVDVAHEYIQKAIERAKPHMASKTPAPPAGL